MYAIVKDGVVIKTGVGEVVEGVDEINHRLDEPTADLIAAGIFEFVHVPQDAPKGKKAGETQIVIDAVAGTVTESFLYVDMTEDEAKETHNIPILAQIDALERKELLPRMLRDLAFKSAAADAAAIGMTLDQVYALASKPGAPSVALAYKKFKDFDESIMVLKRQLR